MVKFKLVREIRELKNKLSYSKNIGFFFGAGASCALGGCPRTEIQEFYLQYVVQKDELAHYILYRKIKSLYSRTSS